MSTVSAAFGPIQQSIAAMRAGQESFANFVVDLFSDLEAMQKKLVQVQSQLFAERDQLAEERQRLDNEQHQSAPHNELDEALTAKVAELENERSALEEELESVRARAVGMAQSLAEQKKQMAEENAQWAAELRQLRRILDKQASWITQHAEMSAPARAGDGYPQTAGTHGFAAAAAPVQNGRAHPTYFPAAAGQAPRQSDAVVGSILSQFELLQKDVARRREHTDQEANS